jgi:asparaginyl-tRNA synthetase
MVEPEMTFADLDKITDLAERLIKQVIHHVLDHQRAELEHLASCNQKELINKLSKVTDQPFPRINYAQALEILKAKKKIFTFNKIK